MHIKARKTFTDQYRTAIIILQLVCFFLFIGRAYQYLFWDAPFRAFFWDEALLKGLVEGLTSYSWNDYVTSSSADSMLQLLIRINGVFFAICAVISLFIERIGKRIGKAILVGAALLFILAVLYSKEKFFHIGQFFEYAAQIISPVILYWMVFKKPEKQQLFFTIKIALALTFVCHGLYAVGYYPRPGNFVDMVINSLGVSEGMAHQILIAAASLDFIVAILLFIPITVKAALYYMAFWGLLTSLARLTANIYADFFWSSLHQWWFEFAIRLPHAFLPLALLLLLKHYAHTHLQTTENHELSHS